MKVWWCYDHETHYPVGGASVVVAETEEEARELLYDKLAEHGLTKRRPFKLLHLNTDKPHAIVINDGDY